MKRETARRRAPLPPAVNVAVVGGLGGPKTADALNAVASPIQPWSPGLMRPPIFLLCGLYSSRDFSLSWPVHHRARDCGSYYNRSEARTDLSPTRATRLIHWTTHPITPLLYSVPINNILYRTCVSLHTHIHDQSAFVKR